MCQLGTVWLVAWASSSGVRWVSVNTKIVRKVEKSSLYIIVYAFGSVKRSFP